MSVVALRAFVNRKISSVIVIRAQPKHSRSPTLSPNNSTKLIRNTSICSFLFALCRRFLFGMKYNRTKKTKKNIKKEAHNSWTIQSKQIEKRANEKIIRLSHFKNIKSEIVWLGFTEGKFRISKVFREIDVGIWFNVECKNNKFILLELQPSSGKYVKDSAHFFTLIESHTLFIIWFEQNNSCRPEPQQRRRVTTRMLKLIDVKNVDYYFGM